MALFKINKGSGTLPSTYIEGYCYFKEDTGRFYIDTTNTEAGRKLINPDSFVGVTRSGTTWTFTTADGNTKTIIQQDNNTNYYHTRVYSSGLKISTGTGVSDMYVPNATASQKGVVIMHPAANCTSFTSDDSTCTVAAVKKAVTLFTNDYAPTKTGGGASGDWGINITGNAATATTFASAKSIVLTGDVTGSASSTGGWSIATTSNQLSYPAVIGTQEALDAFKTNNKFKVGYWNGFTPTDLFTNGIILSGGWTSDAYGWQIAIDDDPTYKIALRQKSTTWSSWKYLAMSDGSNASGDWAIRTRGLYSNGSLTTIEDTDAFIEGNTLKYATVTSEGTSIANDGMIISVPYTGTSWGAQIWLDDGSSAATMQIRNRNGSGWNPWRKVLCDGDLSNYVTLTTAQSISGAKTFATDVTISNTLYPSIIFKNTQNARKSVFEGSYVGSSILWAYSASGDNRRGIAINTADYQSDVKNALWLRTCVDGTWSQYQIITSVGGQTINGSLTASSVYGAVWNDYAEYRETTAEIEPGRVVIENGNDTLSLCQERLMATAQVVSDTFGFAIGETDKAKTPLAVSGRVLVYTDAPRETFQAGDTVCSGINGTVSKMTREEIMMYPERIIGVVSAIPEYETWGTGNVKVNGRIWIKLT